MIQKTEFFIKYRIGESPFYTEPVRPEDLRSAVDNLTNGEGISHIEIWKRIIIEAEMSEKGVKELLG